VLSHRLRGLAAAIAIVIAVFTVHGVSAAASIDAAIEPTQIMLGESARLTITTSGSGTLSVTLPVVSGLEFRIVGRSQQIQMINGTTIESTSTIVRVTPDEAGVFTIPAIGPKSAPLVLRVLPGGSSSSAPNNAGPPDTVPLVPGTTNAEGIRLTPDGSAYVRLEITKHEVYVGESVPIAVQIGMRDGFVTSLNGLPKLNSSDFTLNNLSQQPERGGKVIDGKRFTVLTWRSLLAAVKPGSFSLTFEAPLTVKIRTRPQRDSLLDDLLGDPFMQNFFGATIPKNVNVTSPEAAFTVLPLPAEGKPPDFGGAVGAFKISTDLSSTTNIAGDPLTLRMHVNGAGNFDRVESTMLGADSQWKTYDPKSTFKPTDATGYRGEKTFEQPLIAAQAGAHTVPPLSFSFFDPATHRYETAHSSPLSVTVSPSAPQSATSEPPPPAAIAGTPADESHSGLRPDHTVAAARVSSLTPLYLQPRFLAIPSVLAFLFSAAWVALRRRERYENDIQGARERVRSQLIRTSLQQMAAASAAGHTTVFLESARAALQQALGARWQLAPEQITLADVDTHLGGDTDRQEIRQIFALADEASYSGDELQAADFDRWTHIVRRQIAGDPQS
jgi:hypothetical protein